MRTWGSLASTTGALFGVFCPACIPALAVFLPTIGLGFLANLIVSRVLLLALLGIAIFALHLSSAVHRRQLPFILGLASALAMIAGRSVFLYPWLINGSAAGMIVAAVLDYWYRRSSSSVGTCPIPHRPHHAS